MYNIYMHFSYSYQSAFNSLSKDHLKCNGWSWLALNLHTLTLLRIIQNSINSTYIQASDSSIGYSTYSTYIETDEIHVSLNLPTHCLSKRKYSIAKRKAARLIILLIYCSFLVSMSPRICRMFFNSLLICIYLSLSLLFHLQNES